MIAISSLLTEVTSILVKIVLQTDTGFMSLKALSSGFHLFFHLVSDEAGHHDLLVIQGTGKVQLDQKEPDLFFREGLVLPTLVDGLEVIIAEKTLLKQLKLFLLKLCFSVTCPFTSKL